MSDHPYDRELPILAELERDVTRAAELALEPKDAIAPRPERLHGGRARQGSRVVRRSLVLVALMLLVGATALAATGAFDGGGGDQAVLGPALDAARGEEGGGYRLVLHAHGQTLCQVMVVQGNVATKCQRPPQGDEVDPLSALGAGTRFVVGVTGPQERSVDIKVGGHRVRVPTRPIPPAAARAAGVDPDVRVFIAGFTPRAGSASQPPAIVGGKADCSLTTEQAAVCRVP